MEEPLSSDWSLTANVPNEPGCGSRAANIMIIVLTEDVLSVYRVTQRSCSFVKTLTVTFHNGIHLRESSQSCTGHIHLPLSPSPARRCMHHLSNCPHLPPPPPPPPLALPRRFWGSGPPCSQGWEGSARRENLCKSGHVFKRTLQLTRCLVRWHHHPAEGRFTQWMAAGPLNSR